MPKSIVRMPLTVVGLPKNGDVDVPLYPRQFAVGQILRSHSYVGGATSILADVYELLESGKAPDERRFFLEPREQDGRRYWFVDARS